MPQLLLERPPLGDVVHYADEPFGDAIRRAQPELLHDEVADGTVGPHDSVFVARLVIVASEERLALREQPVLISRVYGVAPHASHDVLGRPAEDRGELRVAVDGAPRRVVEIAADRRPLDEATEPRLALAEALFRRAPLGDVAREAECAGDDAALVSEGAHARFHYPTRATERDDLELESGGPAVAGGLDTAPERVPITLDDERKHAMPDHRVE